MTPHDKLEDVRRTRRVQEQMRMDAKSEEIRSAFFGLFPHFQKLTPEVVGFLCAYVPNLPSVHENMERIIKMESAGSGYSGGANSAQVPQYYNPPGMVRNEQPQRTLSVSPPPNQRISVHDLLEQNDKLLAELHERLAQLTCRLAPILYPPSAPPSTSGSSPIREKPNTLLDHTDMQGNALRVCHAMLSELEQRISL